MNVHMIEAAGRGDLDALRAYIAHDEVDVNYADEEVGIGVTHDVPPTWKNRAGLLHRLIGCSSDLSRDFDQ